MSQSIFTLPLAYLAIALLLAGVIGAPVIYILLFATLAIVAIRLLRGRRLWISGEKATFLFLISLLLFFLGFAFSAQDVADTIFTFNYLPMVLFAPLAAFLAGGAGRENTRIFAWLAFAGLVLIVVTAAIQVHILGTRRAEGLEVDPISMGHTAVILGFFAVVGFPETKGWSRYILLGAPFLGIIGTLLTGSRGPVLGAMPLALIALVFLTKKPVISIIMATLTGALVAVLLSVFWPSAFTRLETLYTMGASLLTEGAVQERSAGLRLEMYYGALKAFLDSPWFGHGWENKFSALTPYFPPEWAGFKGHHHLHADLADTAVASGAIGLVAYTLIIAAPLVGAYTSARDSQYRARVYLASMLSVGYFFFGLTYLLFGYEYHTTLYIILAAAIIGFCRDEPPLVRGLDRNKSVNQ